MIKKLLTLLFLCSTCFGVETLINSFNAGELSPYLESRSDITRYYSGCRTLENFFVLTHGGASKRIGTYYLTSTKSNGKVRLVSFEYSANNAYILEFGDEYIRFYMNDGQILDDSNDTYEIVSPYDINDVFKLQFAQSADVLYIVNNNYPVYKLSRTGNASWDINEVDFNRGAFKDRNLTDTTISMTGDGNTVGNHITLDANSEIWNSNHEGALWQIVHTLPSNTISGNLTKAYTTALDYNGCSITGRVQLNRKFHWTTHGHWTGTVFLEKSYDNGQSWVEVKPFDNQDESNISFNEIETVDDAIYRVRMGSYTSGTCSYSLVIGSFEEKGEVLITDVNDSNTVQGTIHNVISIDSATSNWSEGAWSDDEGYPSAITFFEERLALGGSKVQPQTMWLSVTGDWENFYVSSADDSAQTYTIASDQINGIRWLVAQNALLIGTMGGEWKLTIPEEGAPKCYRQSAYGSAEIQPIMVNNVVLYVQGQNRKIRELAYSYELDSWVSPDLTVISDHITKGGIDQIAYQRTPDPMLWCVVDGNLAVMTYNRDQEVIAWQKINVGGYVESVAVIPYGSEDEVWIEVKRTINGSDVRYIERFKPREYSDVKDSFFVDSGLTFDGGAAKTITGISKANPAILTSAGHGLSDGDQIRISGVSGMTQVNEKVYTVHNPAANTFQLRDATDTVDITSAGFTAYISGGTFEHVENRFTTLNHLEGQTVQVCADGGYVGNKTVTNGTIVLSDYYNKVHAGLGYTAKLVPQRLEFQGNMTMNKVKNIRGINIHFLNSLSCKVGRSWTDYEKFVFRDMSSLLDSPLSMYSGKKFIEHSGDYDTDGDIYIQNDEPLPLTILSIIPEVDLEQ